MLLLATMLISYACYVRAEQNPYARYVAAGFSVIDEWALNAAPHQELFNGAMHGMVAVLHKYGDQHSEFVDADQQAAFSEEFDQEFGGVGIHLQMLGEPPIPTVIGLPEPGTPAAEADIKMGDQLEAVDGQSIAGYELEQVTKLVRGPIGEEVTLTLKRPDVETSHKVTVSRAIIMIESILGDVRGADGRWNYLISEDPRIGYVRIRMFGDKTADELAAILNNLSLEKLDGLVIDVRDDAGGSLDAAVEICELFLRPGRPIVYTRDRDGVIRDRYISRGTGPYADLPLAVLVDRNSASASEIVAACLQDYDRAKIIGERSYGKGTVQRLVRIESGRSLLKLTSATYWRPSEKNIHRMPGNDESAEWGVTPDEGFVVPLTPEEYLAWRNFRKRRDLLGDALDGELAAQLAAVEGEVSPDFRDRALDKAVEYLDEEFVRKTEAAAKESHAEGQ